MNRRDYAELDERERLEKLIEERYGLSLVRWMLDVSSTMRGTSGSLPIDARDVATQLGIQVKQSSEPGAFGSTSPTSDDGTTITIGGDLTPSNANFTIAHELGHVFFMRASSALLSGDALEWACDLFAVMLLAPAPFVDAFLREKGAWVDAIAELAEVLNVPEHAVGLLLSEHYPMSYWRCRVDHLHWMGPFDVGVFDDEVRRFCASTDDHMRIRLNHPYAGIHEWILEGVADLEGGHGLLKPSGRRVREAAAVRTRNIPREQLLAVAAGTWEVTGSVSTQIRGESHVG